MVHQQRTIFMAYPKHWDLTNMLITPSALVASCMLRLPTCYDVSFSSTIEQNITFMVGGIPTPLKNMKVNWDHYSQLNGKNVPNHQPGICWFYHVISYEASAKKRVLCIPCFSSFCLKNISYSQYIYTNQITSIVGVQKKTSNNQTWLKGKFRHVLDDFPSYKARESCSNLDVNHSSKWESRKIPLDPIRMDFFTEIESYYLVQSQ